jgi:hypothetical protein
VNLVASVPAIHALRRSDHKSLHPSSKLDVLVHCCIGQQAAVQASQVTLTACCLLFFASCAYDLTPSKPVLVAHGFLHSLSRMPSTPLSCQATTPPHFPTLASTSRMQRQYTSLLCSLRSLRRLVGGSPSPSLRAGYTTNPLAGVPEHILRGVPTMTPETRLLRDRLVAGDRAALARAITLSTAL